MNFIERFKNNPKNVYVAAAGVTFVLINIVGLVLYQSKNSQQQPEVAQTETITEVVNTPTEGPTPTDFPTPTPEPTALPTKKPTATLTPSPTNTPSPNPTSTPTPTPTNIPLPTVTNTPSPTEIPTPTISVGTT